PPMRRVVLPGLLVGLIVAACSSSTPCPCPAAQTGPGWCPATEYIGTGPGCVCQVTTLCPGWCLPNGETTGTPYECGDAGASPVDAGGGTEGGGSVAPDAAE
ncbi:MAG: hypothetical protein ABSE49_32360, partial [Polyangiaceae bacterium]